MSTNEFDSQKMNISRLAFAGFVCISFANGFSTFVPSRVQVSATLRAWTLVPDRKARQFSKQWNRLAVGMKAEPYVQEKTFQGSLFKALRKPSGSLGIAVEYFPKIELSAVDLDWLSLKLRKAKVSAIFADSSVKSFATEQARAKGNFPGPLPIVSNASCYSQADVEHTKSIGASGIVLRPWGQTDKFNLESSALNDAAALSCFAASKGLDAVWEVHTPSQASLACSAGASVLLLSRDASSSASADPAPWRDAFGAADLAVVATVEAMQADGAEAEAASSLRAGVGATAVLLAGACVGDGEDSEYALWAVEKLSSKASREFRISGMTGHVNGHFGTGTFERPTGAPQWRRMQAPRP